MSLVGLSTLLWQTSKSYVCFFVTRYVPGWDTHGLPIELKVLQGLPAEERKSLDTISLRAKAKEFALKTMDNQRQQFKR